MCELRLFLPTRARPKMAPRCGLVAARPAPHPSRVHDLVASRNSLDDALGEDPAVSAAGGAGGRRIIVVFFGISQKTRYSSPRKHTREGVASPPRWRERPRWPRGFTFSTHPERPQWRMGLLGGYTARATVFSFATKVRQKIDVVKVR